ncbi:MAG: methyltransferase domain-containing protein [Alphaproteobacteria bacterium]|nr:methyltransferase domain-containing protein [Alphaproteobacteria bacterium]
MTDAAPQIFAPKIFDRALYLSRQSKAIATGDLHHHVAGELGDRFSVNLKSFPKTLLIASPAEPAATTLRLSGKIETLHVIARPRDEQIEHPDKDYDAIISLLDLHCVNDVPGHLSQLARALKPDGLLAVAFFGGETLFELRESWLQAEIEITGGASPRVAPMIGVRELGGLMQRAGLALPVADMDHTTLRYADAFALMHEVKAYGYANPLIGRKTNLVSRRFLTKVADYYHAQFSDADGRIRATLELAWAMAWKPHESQSKPLKPGSATHRLVDFLKPKS